MTYFYWYPSAQSSSFTYRCYVFSLQRSEPWKELIQSLFTLKLGVFMTCSSWLVLFGVVQLVYGKPIWQMSINLLVKLCLVVVRLVLILLAYEFIVMKFPQYIKDVVTCELCNTFPTATDEVRIGLYVLLQFAELVYENCLLPSILLKILI